MQKTTLRPSVLAALMALFFFAVPIRAQVADTVEWNALTIAYSGAHKWTPSADSNWMFTLNNTMYARYDTTTDSRIRSPWVRIPSSAVNDSMMLICHGYTNGVCGAEYSICVTSDGIHYDTLLRNIVDGFVYESLYVGAYAGQTVQFEFCHYGLTRTNPYAGTGYHEYCKLVFQQVSLEPTTLPEVHLPGRALCRVGDTMTVAAQYASGSRTGLAYTWHSSLMDTTWTTSGATGNDTARWVYTLAGTDTLTVTATNAFGSDTAWMVYEVYDCSGAASLPWHVDLSEGGFLCFRLLPYNGWGRAIYDGESCLHAFNQSNGAVVLPPVILPADTVPIHVEWKDARMFGNLTYNLLISTTGWDDLAAFDTVGTFVATSSAWASRSADIGAYAGQTVWLAFSCTGTGQGVNIADISVMSDRTPAIASLTASATMLPVGDTAVYNVTLSHGDTSGLTYRWHSSLMNQVHVSGDQWAFVYDRAGVDTISVVLNNPWGADSARVVVDVQDCRVVSSFPWSEDFSHPHNAYYTVCWTINGWSRVTDVVEGGQLRYVMMAGARKKHMLSQPIAIPATGVEHLSLWVEVAGSLVVKVDTSASTDTANYTDTLLVTSNSPATYLWHTANLSAYAGRTVRLGFFRYGSLRPYIDEVKVDYDTLPVVGPVSAPAVGVVDSAIVCTANLRFGATSGLTYKWTSTLMDTSWVDTSQSHTSSFELRYTRAGMDTITVVATNSFGSDTSAPCIVNVIDCHPATTLPWREDFQNGIVCWYKPQGSKLVDAIPYNDPSREHLRHLYLNTQRDTMGSWLISKEIRLPADTALSPTLFWNVASSNAAYRHLYSVLVTDSADYTDTANYTLLYTDNSSHRQFSNYDRLSIDLSRYAGRSIHIAFHNHGNHLAPLAIGLYIDDIEISLTSTPVVSLSLPAEVYAFDSLAYTCTLHEGVNLGMTYTWHSTLLDSTIVSASPTFPVFYTMGGSDTISVVAANAYGSDTATAVVTVVSCYITDYPWLEDFNITGTYSYNTSGGKIPQCWTRYWTGSTPAYAPHIVTTYLSGSIRTRLQTHSSALLLTAGSDPGYAAESIAETPIFTGQLNDKVVSFFYMQENATKGILTVGYMQDDIFVPVCDMPQQQSGRETVCLGNLPSGVNRVAFRWAYSGNSWYGVIIDSVQVLEVDSIPSVRINAPTTAFVGDSAVFRAALVNGRTDSLGYTWHSSLLDSTITTVDPFVSIVYSTTGVDTITLVATNAYGSDTVTATLSVGSHPLPQISLTAPAQVFTGDSLAIRVSLNDCSRNGLTLTWKSTLLDSTWATTAPVAFNGVYEFEGVDTITVIAANAYGADTAVAYIYAVDCNNITLPYVETFEGVSPIPWNTTGQSSLPLCWQMAYNGTNASIHQPTVVSSYQFINSLPDNALLMMAGNSNNGYATWVQAELPAFGAPLSSLAIALDYRYESANDGILTVGYVDDTLGYIPVDTLAPHAGSYTRDSIYFADVAIAGNARIALRYAYNSFFYAAVIDNIEVFINNGILAPDMLTVENVTATCATLRWSEVDTATAYRVSLGGAVSMDTVVTDTTLTLCGLADDADHTVTVVPLVGSDAGRRISTTFHTLMLCAPLANVNISTAGTISWQYDTVTGEEIPVGVVIEVIDQLSQAVVHIDTAYTSPYVPDGLSSGRTYAFAVRTLCPSGTADTAYTVELYVAPTICAELASNTIPSNSRFMDNYWRKSYSQVIYPATLASNVDTLYGISLRVASITQYYSNAAVCYYDVYIGQTPDIPTSPISSDSLVQVAQNAYLYMPYYPTAFTGWVDIIFNTPIAIDPSENLVLTIVDRSYVSCIPVYGMHTDTASVHFVQAADHGDAYTNPATLNFNWETNNLIPDIHLLGGCAPTVCVAPVIAVTDVDTHSVSLAWQQLGAEDQWLVEYRSMTDNSWTAFGTVSNTSCTITGLHPSTGYTIRVAALCSDTLYSLPETVHTICSYMELPYTISFLADEYPCWTLGSNLYHNNWNGIYLNGWNTGGNLISPEVNTPIADLRATITSIRPMAESYESRFAVGVGNADGSNVTWIDTIGFLQQNTVQTNEVHFNHYTGSGRHIILRGVEGTSYIRQFTLEAFAGCVPVHDVTVDNIGEHSAQLTWVPEVATHTWAVYLDGALVATTSTPSYTLIGLNSNTQYTVGVSEICGAGDTSTAVTCLFQTRCDAFALPYFEEFDQAPAIGNDHILTDCWIFHKDGRYASAYCIGDQWSYTCLMFDDDAYSDTHAVNYVCSPRLQVGHGGATVRFKGQTTFDGIFTVGIMPDPYDTTTFIPVRDITVSSGGMAWYSFSTDTIAGAPVGSTLSVAFRFVGDNGHGVIDSLFVEDIPVTTYNLAIGVNDTTMGSVSGAGTYEPGATVLITATATPGHRFVTWSDSVTSPVREFIITENLSLTAYFAPDTTPVAPPDTVWHTVSVVAVMADGSPVTGLDEPVRGAGTYADGDTVVLQGQVNGCGTSLVYWLTATGDTVYDNPYTFVIHSDVSLTAVFREDGGIDSDLQPPTSDITLHPNPATASATISGLQPGMLLTLLDLNGRQLQEFRIQDSELKIDVSSLPAGTYFLRLSSPSATVVRRLVKR